MTGDKDSRQALRWNETNNRSQQAGHLWLVPAGHPWLLPAGKLNMTLVTV